MERTPTAVVLGGIAVAAPEKVTGTTCHPVNNPLALPSGAPHMGWLVKQTQVIPAVPSHGPVHSVVRFWILDIGYFVDLLKSLFREIFLIQYFFNSLGIIYDVFWSYLASSLLPQPLPDPLSTFSQLYVLFFKKITYESSFWGVIPLKESCLPPPEIIAVSSSVGAWAPPALCECWLA